MSKVAVVRCTSYDYSEVKKAVERGLDLIGGPLAFIKPGENILLKPNLLTGDPPEKCVTTHPAVFKADRRLGLVAIIPVEDLRCVYNYNRCIRCYCCQELCPESTIVVKVPLLRRGLNRMKSNYSKIKSEK